MPDLATRCAPLRDAIDAAVAEHPIPAAAIAVVHGGERYGHVAGVRDVASGAPAAPDATFQIASATKTFTALALARLAEQGHVELDAPVQRHLPEFRVADAAASARITLRHLLTHRAGFEGDFCVDTGGGNDALARAVAAMATLPQLHGVGALWSYCNSGYYVAGRAIEVVTGNSYEDALSELVLDPLGLSGAGFVRDPARAVEGHAVGALGVTVTTEPELPRAIRCVLGLSCGVDDLLTYLGSLAAAASPTAGSPLDAGVLAELLWPGPGPTPPPDGQALAWRIESVQGCGVAVGGGNVRGQSTALWLVPERGFALAALVSSPVGGRLFESIKRRAFSDLCDLAWPASQRVPASPEAWRAVLGRYENPTHDLELIDRDGQPMLAMTMKQSGFPFHSVEARAELPPVPCQLYADDRVAVLPQTPFERWGRLVRDPAGSVTHLLMHARAHVASGTGRPSTRAGA